MAALPPQPPGSLPPEPPGFSPAGAPPPTAPPPGPYSPGNAYAGQMPAQPYMSQPMPQPVVVKVHKRTFWLTIAQIIIILKAIVILLLAAGSIAIGVYILAAGHAALHNIPGYDNYATQFGNSFVNAAGAFFFVIAVVPLIIGIVDLILGIIVGRPSQVARWIIIVLDVLSIIVALADFGRVNTNTGDIVLIVYLALQVIVLYALLIDPPTRRNFAGTAR
ncbi:MAG: hypothetical protein WAW53_12645 [Candidatus Dormiibacterota bacterium]